MKRIFTSFLALSCFAAPAFSQEAPTAQTAEDYRKMEPKILEDANYILSTPKDDSNTKRSECFQEILLWMSNTADFTFEIDEPITRAAEKDNTLLGVYLAAISKYALEHRDEAKDGKGLRLSAYTLFLEYCANDSNGVKKNKELKKMQEAKKEGKLKEYLKL